MLASKEPTIYASAVSLALYTMKDIEAWVDGEAWISGEACPTKPREVSGRVFRRPPWRISRAPRCKTYYWRIQAEHMNASIAFAMLPTY